MDAKEYLSQAFYLNKQIKAKEKRLEWLRDIAPGPSMRFSEEAKVPGNHRSSAVENAAIKVVALEEEIAADILRLVDVVKDIEKTISRVDSIECRTILESRYLSFMGWDEIAARMGYDSNHVYYLHRKALRMVS
jgi:DNA-directed RNA polymerase specialized sigma subunit